MSDLMRQRTTIICGPTDCPADPEFEHDNYYGCIPKTFNGRTGRAKGHAQVKRDDGVFVWDGGCDYNDRRRERETEQ